MRLTSKSFRGEAADGKSYFGMRTVPFIFTPDGEARKDAVRVVRALADHFELRTGGQRFRVIAAKGMIHLVPQLNRDKRGVLVEQRPALDTRISLPAGIRRLSDFVDEVAAALSEHSGRKIDRGTLNLMHNREVTLPAFKNIPARTVLREAFVLSGVPLSWRLFGGPGNEDQVLNVHAVVALRAEPAE